MSLFRPFLNYWHLSMTSRLNYMKMWRYSRGQVFPRLSCPMMMNTEFSWGEYESVRENWKVTYSSKPQYKNRKSVLLQCLRTSRSPKWQTTTNDSHKQKKVAMAMVEFMKSLYKVQVFSFIQPMQWSLKLHQRTEVATKNFWHRLSSNLVTLFTCTSFHGLNQFTSSSASLSLGQSHTVTDKGSVHKLVSVYTAIIHSHGKYTCGNIHRCIYLF